MRGVAWRRGRAAPITPLRPAAPRPALARSADRPGGRRAAGTAGHTARPGTARRAVRGARSGGGRATEGQTTRQYPTAACDGDVGHAGAWPSRPGLGGAERRKAGRPHFRWHHRAWRYPVPQRLSSRRAAAAVAPSLVRPSVSTFRSNVRTHVDTPSRMDRGRTLHERETGAREAPRVMQQSSELDRTRQSSKSSCIRVLIEHYCLETMQLN